MKNNTKNESRNPKLKESENKNVIHWTSGNLYQSENWSVACA